ncbi:MAG TPA: cytidylate kinase family protein [Patescibacteria group bacterium]|nr:cytidylate kinase family protein [Patescibacteria group bacterium]
MIISFNGDEGAGKSTIAQEVAEKLKFPRYYIGQIFRDLAKKNGMTVGEYGKKGTDDPTVDKEVDDYILNLSNTQDNFVIEGRMAFHIIPHSIKIYLKVNERTGAERIFHQLKNPNDRNETRNQYENVDEVMQKIKKRKETDNFRYQKYYNVDIRDEKNYDLVLDTTNLSREEAFDKVMAFVESKIKS